MPSGRLKLGLPLYKKNKTTRFKVCSVQIANILGKTSVIKHMQHAKPSRGDICETHRVYKIPFITFKNTTKYKIKTGAYGTIE